MNAELTAPVLDHVVINARDQLDKAAAVYSRLGFFLTPRGYHSLGSINHLAVFGSDYLELVGVPPGKLGARPELVTTPFGFNGYVFRSENAASTYDSLEQAGVAASPAREFSRPVELEPGPAVAKFRTVMLDKDVFPLGRVYFCEHLTPSMVWRPEWQDHPNGAVALCGVVWVAADPERYAATWARIFGRVGIVKQEGGYRFTLDTTSVEIFDRGRFGERYGDAAAPLPAQDFMACIKIKTKSMDRTAAYLAENEIHCHPGHSDSVVIPAALASGVVLEFCP